MVFIFSGAMNGNFLCRLGAFGQENEHSLRSRNRIHGRSVNAGGREIKKANYMKKITVMSTKCMMLEELLRGARGISWRDHFGVLRARRFNGRYGGFYIG